MIVSVFRHFGSHWSMLMNVPHFLTIQQNLKKRPSSINSSERSRNSLKLFRLLVEENKYSHCCSCYENKRQPIRSVWLPKELRWLPRAYSCLLHLEYSNISKSSRRCWRDSYLFLRNSPFRASAARATMSALGRLGGATIGRTGVLAASKDLLRSVSSASYSKNSSDSFYKVVKSKIRLDGKIYNSYIHTF